MQHDDHIWAWRAWRFWKTGQMIRRIELGDDGQLKYTYIDPSDFYVR